MSRTRRCVQFGFLLLVLVGVYVVGGNCERWCPFGGVEALYTYVHEGNMLCSLGTANFFMLGGVLLMTLLMRRAFCGYACPIGTISEWLRGWLAGCACPKFESRCGWIAAWRCSSMDFWRSSCGSRGEPAS